MSAARDMPHIHYELTRDGNPHPDGDTAKTKNPMPYFVGCFGTSLPNQQKLELTYPVLCKSSPIALADRLDPVLRRHCAATQHIQQQRPHQPDQNVPRPRRAHNLRNHAFIGLKRHAHRCILAHLRS